MEGECASSLLSLRERGQRALVGRSSRKSIVHLAEMVGFGFACADRLACIGDAVLASAYFDAFECGRSRPLVSCSVEGTRREGGVLLRTGFFFGTPRNI